VTPSSTAPTSGPSPTFSSGITLHPFFHHHHHRCSCYSYGFGGVHCSAVQALSLSVTFTHGPCCVCSLGKQREEPAAPSTEGLRPEIHHQFRKPEKRPPPTVSMTFTALVVGVPVLVLFVGVLSASDRNCCPSSHGLTANTHPPLSVLSCSLWEPTSATSLCPAWASSRPSASWVASPP
jgi:hypothetical protein